MPDLRPGTSGDAANDAAHPSLHSHAEDARHAATQAGLAAALMGLGRQLDGASRVLSACALIALVLKTGTPAVWCALLLVIIAGVAELGYALRCAFDAPLFADWARRWQAAEAQPLSDLAAFDLALAESRLRAAPPNTRPLEERIAGARRLLRRQAQCLALQVLAWGAALALLLLAS